MAGRSSVLSVSRSNSPSDLMGRRSHQNCRNVSDWACPKVLYKMFMLVCSLMEN